MVRYSVKSSLWTVELTNHVLDVKNESEDEDESESVN